MKVIYKGGPLYLFQHYITDGYWKYMATGRMRTILKEIRPVLSAYHQERIDIVLLFIDDKEAKAKKVQSEVFA